MAEPTVSLAPRSRRHGLLYLLPYVLAGIILTVLPPFFPPYYQSLMVKVLIFAIFAMSLDLIMGYTGLPSLGHAAYFGLAGYVGGLLMLRYDVSSFWVVMPAGLLASVIAAAAFGVIALRVKEIYFLLVTFALGQLLFYIAWYWRSMTGGDDGLVGRLVPNLGIPGIQWNPITFYYFVFVFFVISFVLMRWITRLPFGSALKGIEQKEMRMQSLGYNTWAIKYIIFIVGALFAGLAGLLFVYFNGFVVPRNLGLAFSGEAMFMVILGGAATLYGPVIGAATILALEYVSSIYFPQRWPLVFGAAFILTAMFVRGGIALYLNRFWSRITSKYGR